MEIPPFWEQGKSWVHDPLDVYNLPMEKQARNLVNFPTNWVQEGWRNTGFVELGC